MKIHATALPYESSVRPTPVTARHLFGQWFCWGSVAVAIDLVPLALMWATSHRLTIALRIGGRGLTAIGFVLAAIALLTVARLIRLSIRTRAVERASYAFLAFINFKAGLFACGLLAILSRF